MVAQLLPEKLLAVLHFNFGTIAREASLSGVAGDGGVARFIFHTEQSVIVKCSPTPRERNFYERCASLIQRTGVGIADLYWSGSDYTGRYWIVIEDVLKPLPQERWVCDPEQIEMLFRLHSGTWKDRIWTLNEEAYRPVWNEELTRRACEWFDATERNKVENHLTTLQREAQVLFQSICCISADPNTTNWRMRDNEDLILIDWERFSYGHPAVDLAITMPGLGSKDGTLVGKIAEL